MTLARACAILALSATLSGCGQSEASKVPVEPPVIGFYGSTKECHLVGKIPIDLCAKAIEQAGVEHDTRTTLYSRQKYCEAAAGAGNCEPSGGDHYRPRLQAYIVTKQGDAVTARGLYAVTGSPTPFKDLDSNLYSVNDDHVKVSASVQAIAAVISPSTVDASGGIGEAAANVH